MKKENKHILILRWLKAIFILSVVISFLYSTRVYYTDEYVDYNKETNMSFVVKTKINENAAYKTSARYLLICENIKDKKLCTIIVNPQTYVTTKVNEIVTFIISKRELNFYTRAKIYKEPITDGKSILITLFGIVTLFIASIGFAKTSENNVYEFISYVCLFIALFLYDILLLIRNIFFI